MARKARNRESVNTDRHFVDEQGQVQPKFADADGMPIDPSMFNQPAPEDVNDLENDLLADLEAQAGDDVADDDEIEPVSHNADFTGQGVAARAPTRVMQPRDHLNPVIPGPLSSLAACIGDDATSQALARINPTTDDVVIERLDASLNPLGATQALSITIGGQCLISWVREQFPHAAYYRLRFVRDGKPLLKVDLRNQPQGQQAQHQPAHYQPVPHQQAQPAADPMLLELFRQQQAMLERQAAALERMQERFDKDPMREIGAKIFERTLQGTMDAVTRAAIPTTGEPASPKNALKTIAAQLREAKEVMDDAREVFGGEPEEDFSFDQLGNVVSMFKTFTGNAGPDPDTVAGEALLKNLPDVDVQNPVSGVAGNKPT